MSELTAEYVRAILKYDPEEGSLTWLHRPRSDFVDERAMKIWNTKNAGKAAGSIDRTRGVCHLVINRKKHKIHRVIWLIQTGAWPANLVEHKDMNPSNNRWNNLREATKGENGMNRIAPRNNSSGLKGAVYYKRHGTWMGKIKIKGKTLHLGYFSTPEAAHAAYCVAAELHYGEFARSA